MKENEFEKKKKKAKRIKAILDGLEEKTKPNIIDRYTSMDTKGNLNNSMIKTVVELAGGFLVAPAISAALGTYSPLAAALMGFGGNYFGDQTGLMRGIAMGTIAHGVAKSKEYREENTTMKDRLSGLKDDWLRTILLKNTQSQEKNKDDPDQSIVKTNPPINKEPKTENLNLPNENPSNQNPLNVVRNKQNATEEQLKGNSQDDDLLENYLY